MFLNRGPASGDGGFTLVEALVSLAIIGTVMAGTAPFLVQSVSVVSQERTEQGAVAVANDALERVHALNPSSLLAGRGLAAVGNQLNKAPTAAQTAFADTELSSDPMLAADPTAGDDAALPTAPVMVTSVGVEYQQNWYVGRCWQSKADPTELAVAVSDCVAAPPTGPGVVPVLFFRVVVAVAWQEKSCVQLVPQPSRPADECVYVASALVSPSSDPIFDLKRPLPTIPQPMDQAGYVLEPVNLKLFATGGDLPRSWSATGLPAGLTLAAGTGIITGKPTTAKVSVVTVEVMDRNGISGDQKSFTWTVANLPVLIKPANRVSRTGAYDTIVVGGSDGLQPWSWSATGLPAGLSIDPLSGVISGLLTTAGTRTVTVSIEDAGRKTKSVSFSWRVLTPVTLAPLGSFTMTTGDTVTFNAGPAADGGATPYTWKATNLPPGLTMAAGTGVISGTVTRGTRYLATIDVTDSVGGTGGKATGILLLNVTPRPTDLRVTQPDPASPDRTTAVGAPVTLTAAAAGTSGYKWTATGLPPGLAFSTTGVISKSPTTPGTYVVTFAVTDAALNVAKLMFVWTVTP